MITSDNTFLKKLDRVIDDNIDNHSFSVDSICQLLGVSRSQLHRIIKEQTDLSTSLYIRKRRLLKARHLLLTTDLRISEIGDVVGITNPQNFSTYFIDEFKASPTVFRKLNSQFSTPTVSPSPPGITPNPEPLPTTDGPAEIPPVRSRLSKRRRLTYAGIVAGLLLIVGAGLYVRYLTRPVSRLNQPAGNSLAVLPFVNLGADDSRPACEGIMDDVHRSVALVKNLKVIARSSSDQYRDTKKSIWQIGDELGVANLLKGSVLKTGGQLQIKVDIIGTADDVRRWSHTYRVDYADVFTITDRIVRDVAGQLNLPGNELAAEKTAPPRPQNPAANNLTLQGRQLLISRTTADIQAALVRFDRALLLDSTLADACAFKAVAYHLLTGSKTADTQALNRLTEESALKAIRLDPANSTAYGVLGSLYYSTYQWQASENAFRIALQHNPNDAQANYWYSLFLRTLGRVDEAVQYSTQAIALDPLHPIMMGGHIINCMYAGRTDLVKANIDIGRGLFDHSFSYRVSIAYEALHRQDYEQAVANFQQALILNPEERGQIPLLIYAEAKRGNRRRAIDFLRGLSDTPRADYERAVVYAGINQADSSMHYLKKAADRGYLYRDTKVIDPFRPYHAHPLFRAVLRRFNLPGA